MQTSMTPLQSAKLNLTNVMTPKFCPNSAYTEQNKFLVRKHNRASRCHGQRKRCSGPLTFSKNFLDSFILN